MNLPAPFYWLGDHIAIDLPGARALFTTRRGGASSGPYATLNLGRLTGDEAEAVDRNRFTIESLVGASLSFVRQVHGTTVVNSEQAPSAPGALVEADGVVAAQEGLAPAVLTADCLPIVVAGRGATAGNKATARNEPTAGNEPTARNEPTAGNEPTAVAMLHGGWRGLAGGIVEQGVRALRERGPDGPLTAAIGPGAGGCCYEVGEEVHAAFGNEDAGAGLNLDLKAIARARLERAGVAEIYDTGLCTICSNPSLFFSHRRDRGVTGRQAGIVWLT